MSKVDERVSLLNKASQLKRVEAKVKALSKSARTRRGKGFSNHIFRQNCFGPRKKYPQTLYNPGKGFLSRLIQQALHKKIPVTKKTAKHKRGKGWGNLAGLGLSTAAKGIWKISSAGKSKRQRDQEALNKIRQDYYANHYHR